MIQLLAVVFFDCVVLRFRKVNKSAELFFDVQSVSLNFRLVESTSGYFKRSLRTDEETLFNWFLVLRGLFI